MAHSPDFSTNSALLVSISYSNPFYKAGIQFSIQMFTMNMLYDKKKFSLMRKNPIYSM